MAKQSDRPARNRSVLITLELCLNKGHGTFGSVEVITSLTREPWNLSKFWELGEHQKLTSLQVADLTAYVMSQVQDCAVTRIQVQDGFPGVLST